MNFHLPGLGIDPSNDNSVPTTVNKFITKMERTSTNLILFSCFFLFEQCQWTYYVDDQNKKYSDFRLLVKIDRH